MYTRSLPRFLAEFHVHMGAFLELNGEPGRLFLYILAQSKMARSGRPMLHAGQLIIP
jgi:hypothetical protein